MKSLALLSNLYTNLANNSSSDNQALGIQLMGDRQRYLLQKYFDNERQFTTSTIGSMTLALTGMPLSGAASATLSVAWAYPTGTQGVNFTNSTNDTRQALFTNGSTAITWQIALTSNTTVASIGTQGFQKYAIPASISKITNSTLTVGQLKFIPAPVETRTEWDTVNFLPYSSDIPNYFFIYAGNLELWPIPSTTGNIITFNYKTRVPDFSTAFLFSDTSGAAFIPGQKAFDYQKGTVAALAGGTTVTGTSTAWNTTGKFPLNTDVSFYNLYLIVNAPFGDGYAYPISQFNSDTSLTLSLPILNAPNLTGASYTIGQYPILQEDFHDMLVYGSLSEYYTYIAPDPNKFKENDQKYKDKLLMMSDYSGTKTVNYNLGERPALLNPNNYPYYPNGVNS